MNLLSTFAGLSEFDLLMDQQQPAGSVTPRHCGGPMELQTPSLGPATVGYTFEPAGIPLELPPVWRCACGFQLDAWVPPGPGPLIGAAGAPPQPVD